MKIINKLITVVILICLSIVFITSCCNKTNQSKGGKTKQTKSEVVIYKGHQWDIIKINDSIFIVSPGLNAGKNNVPIMFNVNRNPNALDNFK